MKLRRSTNPASDGLTILGCTYLVGEKPDPIKLFGLQEISVVGIAGSFDPP